MEKFSLIEKNPLHSSIDLLARMELFEKRGGFITCPLLLFEKTGKLLCEGLIKSYSADFIIKTLKRRFLLTSKYNEYLKNNNYQGYINSDSAVLRFGKREKEKSVIEMIIPNNRNDINRLTNFILACGWYIANKETTNDCKDGDILLVFEKKYERVLKNNGIEVPNILYHITQECYLDKILKNGLIPKHKDKLSKHPDRIYFLTKKYSDDELSIFSKQFFIRNSSDNYVEYNKMVLLTIDITPIKNSIKFYADPNADECVFTYDNVSKDLIIGINKIK